MANMETQELILAELNKLGKQQAELLAKVGSVETSLAVVKSQLLAGEKRFELCDGHFQRTAALEMEVGVIKEKLTPLQRIVYGGVALVLVALGGAVIAGVLK